ncbi:chromatin associated protein KTI12 [Infundibulicybe gibba]|nr:chromatin associated protein KTI12 [Infundibulicybe gibba]
MALITLSGFPCSGKTFRANQLSAWLHQKLQDPAYDDQLLNIPPSVYDASYLEKPARGALFTAIQRHMSLETILIIDALNYIKGFRYQIYCAAREFKLRVCTVHVLATPEVCKERNSSRPDQMRYHSETLDNLLVRYEEPSSMVRWDSPLFTVLWSDEQVPALQIWDAVTKGNVKPPNSGTLSVAKAPIDALHTLEQATTSMVNAIMSAQALSHGCGGLTALTISPTLKLELTLPARNITLSEMQRHKRQFVTVHKKAITLGTTEKGAVSWGEGDIANKFVVYLEEHLH